jgi:hypothetical protein
VKDAYSNMVSTFTVSAPEQSKFFSDKNNPNAIVIYYNPLVKQTINNENPSDPFQKRYRALYYQQRILDNIFTYYNNHQENFYRIAESKEIEKNELNNLYNSVVGIKDTLSEFEGHYDSFIDATSDGVSDIMEFNITSYSFQLNKVIDASFDFIYKFHDIYVNYCIDDYSSYNATNLGIYVDKAYLDMSYMVYLENIKSFNYSVGNNGVCDLADVVGNETEYGLIDLLNEKKSLSETIVGNVGASTEAGEAAKNSVDIFVYCKDVFEQRLTTYLHTYNKVNMYNLNQYKFGLNGNVNYNSYLTSLSASDRATVKLLENFVQDTFLNYMNKLSLIVN